MIFVDNLKIQVKTDGQPWADLECVPDLHSYDAAREWLKENGCEALQKKHDLRFRIMPKDFPCAYTAVLERKRVQ